MSMISSPITSFVQGVSQQTPMLRLPSQLEIQENAVPSMTEGLIKRPPLKVLAKISDTALTGAKIHFTARDLGERYVVVVQSGSLRVFDKDTGVEKTVNAPGGFGYLTTASPSKEIKLLSIADYTFIANSTVTAAMLSTLSPAQPFVGLVAVKQGSYDANYSVWIDGVRQAHHVSGNSVSDHTKSDFIAAQLATSLTTNLGAGWTVQNLGSSVSVRRNDGAKFRITVTDSRGGEALKLATTEAVQRFTDLPNAAPDGFTTEVIGDPGNEFDNYYVTFRAVDQVSTFAQGVWRETLKPGIKYALDPATMPHQLVREADGTFTFGPCAWEPREVGDTESCPDPSFIGREIRGIVFAHNRLGFLAGANVVMSRPGSYWNFFKESAKIGIDSDPIDIAATYQKVVNLYHGVSFDRKLVLFSDQSQWVLESASTFAPSQVEMKLLTEYEADPSANPAGGVGNSVYFATRRGNYTAVHELQVLEDTDRAYATDESEHVPAYIPRGVHTLTASSAEEMLAAFSPQEPSHVYAYNWHWSERSKDQSAWHRFSLAGATILDIAFFESELFVVLIKGAKTIIGAIHLDPGHQDDGEPFLIHLDYRLDETQMVSKVYSAGTNTTTLTLPFPMVDPLVVSRVTPHGDLLGSHSGGATSTVTVLGDHTATPLYVGEGYLWHVRLSQFTYQRPDGRGRTISVSPSSLRIRNATITFDDTFSFRVEVSIDGRQTYTYRHTGRQLGTPSATLGALVLDGGDITFPVHGKASSATIDLKSDSYMPVKILAGVWSGIIRARTRRVFT